MSDKQLLELAAKAAGIEYGWQHIYDDYEGSTSEKWDWNPLTDDGDALRLAVNLGLVLELNVSEGAVHAYQHTTKSCTELVGNDALKATRRAITRAAAEIGRAL